MGKVLIIKGADFSQNAIKESYNLVIEQGAINLIIGSSSGGYIDGGGNLYKRIRTPNTNLIYIEAGQEFTITGLQGDGSVPILCVDAAIYSSAENPRHATFLHSLNGDTTDYYKFNIEGNDSFDFVAPYTGYYAFCFAGPTTTEEVLSTNYNTGINL